MARKQFNLYISEDLIPRTREAAQLAGHKGASEFTESLYRAYLDGDLGMLTLMLQHALVRCDRAVDTAQLLRLRTLADRYLPAHVLNPSLCAPAPAGPALRPATPPAHLQNVNPA